MQARRVMADDVSMTFRTCTALASVSLACAVAAPAALADEVDVGGYTLNTTPVETTTDSYGTGSYGTGSYGTGSYGTGSYGTGSYGTGGDSPNSYGTG